MERVKHQRALIVAAVVLILSSLALSQPSPDRVELDRLRRENAALKAEVAKLQAEIVKLKGELDAAKPPLPKATRYTPEMIVKLVPADAMPARGEKSGPRVSKVNKVLAANLVGEWVRMEAKIEDVAEQEGEKGKRASLRARHPTTVDPAFFTDFIFDGESIQGLKKTIGQTVAVVGKVKNIQLDGTGDVDGPPHFILVLVECRLVK